MTTCLVLAILLVCTSTIAFAGTKYSDAVGFGKVLVRPTATPAPTEEPDDYYFERDASGNLVLDSDGDPVVYIPDGFRVPSGFQRDENGNLVLDGSGDPIMLFGEIKPEATPAPEATEEPAVEPTEEPVVEATEEPAVEPTEEPAVEPTEEPAVEPTEEPVVEPTEEPVVEPTEEPVVEATEEPAVEPTEEPVVEKTEEPAEEPAVEETEEPAKETEPEITLEPMPTAPEADPIEEPAEEIVEGPTALGDADVRIAADGLSEIFITLPEGTALVVLAVEGDWIKVDVDGQIGYIYKDSVQGLAVEEPELPEDSETAGEPAAPEMKVTIFSSRRTVMTPGETVYLTSKLEGFEGYTVSYQWQCDRGNGLEDVPGANEATYAFEANAETLGYDWLLLVYFE